MLARLHKASSLAAKCQGPAVIRSFAEGLTKGSTASFRVAVDSLGQDTMANSQDECRADSCQTRRALS
jgi:hypothetical protein